MATEVEFSELLRSYRKSMGWTQEEMSQKWSYSFETISAWERKKRIPSRQEIPRLAKFLEVGTETLSEIIQNSRGNLLSLNDQANTLSQTRASWKTSYETWGELQHIYLTRTEFNKEFSYPRMFENASSILAVGISLNAIAMNYDRELIKKAVLEKGLHIQLCFLDPMGKYCQEREKEEDHEKGILARLTDANIVITRGLQKKIEKVENEKAQLLEIRVYDMIPRFNIYIVNDTLMTVQGYAYGRGEETPVFVLERKTYGGIFDHYVSIAKHILANSINV